MTMYIDANRLTFELESDEIKQDFDFLWQFAKEVVK